MSLATRGDIPYECRSLRPTLCLLRSRVSSALGSRRRPGGVPAISRSSAIPFSIAQRRDIRAAEDRVVSEPFDSAATLSAVRPTRSRRAGGLSAALNAFTPIFDPRRVRTRAPAGFRRHLLLREDCAAPVTSIKDCAQEDRLNAKPDRSKSLAIADRRSRLGDIDLPTVLAQPGRAFATRR